MVKHKLWIGSLIISISVVYFGCNSSSEKKLNDTAVNVKVHQATTFDGSEEITYSGTIEESESTPLCFSGIGTVSQVYVNEGDYVKKGQLLATLNDETYKNTYEMTLAALKQAEDAYKRLQPMYKNGNLPEVKLVEVETGLQQSKAAAAISKKNLEDCKLYSPVSGFVGKRSVDPGMSAMPNLASINIVNIEKVFARVPVSENEIASIKKGDKAKIKIAALNNEEFTGTIEEIGVLADPLAHTYKIKIGISNSAHQIKPGMICNVSLSKKTNEEGLFIPSQAVLVDELGRNFVYVVNNNKAEKRFIKTGKLLRNGVEVIEGINNNEQVITVGLQKLVDNATINIIN